MVASLIGDTKPKGQDCPISSDPVPVFTPNGLGSKGTQQGGNVAEQKGWVFSSLHMPWSENFSYSCDAS